MLRYIFKVKCCLRGHTNKFSVTFTIYSFHFSSFLRVAVAFGMVLNKKDLIFFRGKVAISYISKAALMRARSLHFWYITERSMLGRRASPKGLARSPPQLDNSGRHYRFY